MGDTTTTAVDYMKYLVALCITSTEPVQGDLGGFNLSRQIRACRPNPDHPRIQPQDLGEMITRNEPTSG